MRIKRVARDTLPRVRRVMDAQERIPPRHCERATGDCGNLILLYGFVTRERNGALSEILLQPVTTEFAWGDCHVGAMRRYLLAMTGYELSESALDAGEVIEFSGAVAEKLCRHAHAVEHAEVEVVHWGVFRALHMATGLNGTRATAGEDNR